MNQLRDTIAAGENIGKDSDQMDELDFAANKWLKPYPNALWRENVEVILVAVAMHGPSARFSCNLKSTNGQMPTDICFGVVSQNYLSHYAPAQRSGFQKSRPLGRVREWFEGIIVIHDRRGH